MTRIGRIFTDLIFDAVIRVKSIIIRVIRVLSSKSRAFKFAESFRCGYKIEVIKN